MCAGFLSRGGALTAALYGFLIALKDMRLEYIIILTIQVFTVIFQVMLCPITPTKVLSERLRRPFGASPFGNLRLQILRFFLKYQVYLLDIHIFLLPCSDLCSVFRLSKC